MRKIVSGGQTGVDRAALDVGLALELPVGGWCPNGRRTAEGCFPRCGAGRDWGPRRGRVTRGFKRVARRSWTWGGGKRIRPCRRAPPDSTVRSVL
ncbi:MAG: hypothetical protein EA420_17120 [Candidatus Competibacteraceae bacterium]|nr:MAG: hypothetical protein EA420_17120 [Candidatus Competibacteraceae bacterium]